MMKLLVLCLALALPVCAQQVFPPSGGSGAAAIACVGTPGNTTGAYRQQCQVTSTGAVWACNNIAGCTVAADWVAVAGTGAASIGTVNHVQASNGAGAFADSGCTSTASVMTCSGGFTGGSSSVLLLDGLEGTAPANPAANHEAGYYDSTLHNAVGINSSGTELWRGASPNERTRSIGWHFDGGGSALSGTQTGCYRVPFAGTITGWHVDADLSGSATFAVKTVAFASYTGVAGFSGYTDMTGGGTAPAISSVVTATFANLTSWTTTFSGGLEWCFQMTSPATSTWVNVTLDTVAN